MISEKTHTGKLPVSAKGVCPVRGCTLPVMTASLNCSALDVINPSTEEEKAQSQAEIREAMQHQLTERAAAHAADEAERFARSRRQGPSCGPGTAMAEAQRSDREDLMRRRAREGALLVDTGTPPNRRTKGCSPYAHSPLPALRSDAEENRRAVIEKKAREERERAEERQREAASAGQWYNNRPY